MQTDDMIFRTVYVDKDVDQAVVADAKRLGAAAGSVYRLYLESGLAQLRQGAKLPAADGRVTLRTVYVPHSTDELLLAKGVGLRIAPMELSRRVTRLGMLALHAVCDDGGLAQAVSKAGGLATQRAGMPVIRAAARQSKGLRRS